MKESTTSPLCDMDELAKAEVRFRDLTAAGFTAAVRSK
jgi:hypothetical protein